MYFHKLETCRDPVDDRLPFSVLFITVSHQASSWLPSPFASDGCQNGIFPASGPCLGSLASHLLHIKSYVSKLKPPLTFLRARSSLVLLVLANDTLSVSAPNPCLHIHHPSVFFIRSQLLRSLVTKSVLCPPFSILFPSSCLTRSPTERLRSSPFGLSM